MKIVKSGLILIVLLISACQQAAGMETLIPAPVDNHEDMDAAVQYGEAEYIDSVRAVYPPAWPEEMQIVVNGFLPDGCTEIYSVEPVRDENRYTVKIYTKREVGIVCTEALEPFEEMFVLDTSGLGSGNYSVFVYGKSTEFSLEIPADSNDAGG
jgi:hypothetical protein